MASRSFKQLHCWFGEERLLGLCLGAALLLPSAAAAQSVFTSRPDDPAGVYLTADGADEGDDTAALQTAIDKAGASFGGGLVFVPSGRYRLTRTIYVWRGVRLVGYGATRPVFVLPDDTPGFQTGMGVLVMFSGGGPAARHRVAAAVAFPFHRLAAFLPTNASPTPTRAPSIQA